MRRLAGLHSATLIHHSLTDCIPLKAQHANTISSTAGHLTSTSLTQLHANSITANAAPLTNTSVKGLEILRLYRNTWNHAVSLWDNHPHYLASVTFVALLLIPSFVSEDAECHWKKVVLILFHSAHNSSGRMFEYGCLCEGSHSNPIMISYFTKTVHH